MNFQPYQLLFIIFYAIGIVSFFKIKKKWFRLGIVILIVIITLFNPVRFKQKGGAQREQAIDRFSNMPEQIIINTTTFENIQQQEMEIIKKESENLKNEIHN